MKVLAKPSGLVLVRTGRHGPLVQLTSAADIPVGSLIDARGGTVQLVRALPRGTQTATVGRGRFTIAQPRSQHGMTRLRLAGGNFAACPSDAAQAATARKKAKATKVVRRLWSKDNHGKFQTYGHNSVATVRGTEWLTQDRCDGTLTTVIRGIVAIRPHGSTRATIVNAGHSHLAR